MQQSQSATSSLTGSSRTRNDSEHVSAMGGTLEEEATVPDVNACRRLAMNSTTVEDNGSASNHSKEKKSRRSSKEVQRQNAVVAAGKSRNSTAMKVATRLIQRSINLPDKHPAKQSINEIVRKANERYNSNISAKTAARYVRQGIIGQSPLKRGPVGPFPKPIFAALKGAFVTYLKLEQAHSRKQSNIKQMSKLVNATVNKAGFEKTRDDLTRKLQRETADQFEVGKANVMEQRRVQWTTSYNLNVWFSTWKDTLIELGFAREKEAGDVGVKGELVFFDGQLKRIINFDETDGSIDDTTGQRGGRPPMTFHAPDLAGGATAVNKSGYSSTIICGSNAAGEPLPPHFQLKTMAQTNEKQRMSVEWFASTKNIIAQFGHQSERELSCTFGMNEKAGMNATELDKYIENSILPLYPDIEDTPLKRVIMKADSGPGRMNVDMLARLRLHGLYMVPEVPNTTGATQETDQNYGPFKSGFRSNIRLLSQARFDQKLSLHVTDLPLLVFGGTCSKTGVQLPDTFNSAFSVEANLACWKKCGAVPLTRSPLLSNNVRHEVPMGAAAALVEGTDEDPAVQQLRRLEEMNHFHCDYLSMNGFDGSQLRLNAPRRQTYVAVTAPHSKERVKAIKDAKTAGQLFFATGGKHINTDEFFKAREMKKREEAIAKMEEAKKQRGLYCKEQKGAVLLLRKKGELTAETEREFTLPEIKTLLKWKKVKPTSSKKRDMVDAYIAAPKPKIQKIWSRFEEEELQKLKAEDIPLQETAIGVVTRQMARAVTKNLSQLDQETISHLKEALGGLQEGQNVL